MAKATLPTNYRDDILNVSTEGKRKYRMNYNDDGTVSFVDVTPYDQEGSDFGAGDINATNEAVNQSFDKSKLIRDMDAINALTQEGYVPDALALKEVNNSLGGFSFKTVDGKKQVSTDGGSTWSNFSSGAELLWTNPAPTSLFNAQTLSIDLSNYESVIIQAKGWYTVNTYTPLKIMIPKDGKPHLIIGNQADYTGKMGAYANIWYAREATLTNDSIIFGNGYATGSSGANNNACIPLEIYGTGLSLE